jgi:glycine oxidase
MANTAASGKASADMIVVGAGVIGLSIAAAATRRGMRPLVVDGRVPGTASRVAAGLLAPSLGTLPPAAAAEFRRAMDGYPAFLDAVRKASGHSDIGLGRGILEVALAQADPGLPGETVGSARLTAEDIARRAPELIPVAGGILHSHDGWLEPQSLIDGLIASLPLGTIISDKVTGIRRGADIGVQLESGDHLSSGRVVVAAGCWSPMISGLPTGLPIVPARGEVIVVAGPHALSIAVACEDAYLVPRRDGVVVGSTFELVGYDTRSTVAGRTHLEAFARTLIPTLLQRARSVTAWAGLRPMTPDKLPIIDVDPVDDRILYACGHGKNGLLLAGLSAEIVLSLAAGNRLDPDSPFRIGRFKTG